MTKEFEKEMILKGMKAIEKCINEHKDIELALTLIGLCKCLGGEKFHVEVVDE